ncbi:hypothetical protein [Chryseobacterium arthrosphaerae]|uniref:hypothetical protein n=1 Tax=Chryseobacterium arthrosphaerae TaxID=651561 RepID=UPI001F4A66B0|nr:hypothetical protein [Chryseobacterium arthrosphaerae]
MDKIFLQKEKCYKINLPSDNNFHEIYSNIDFKSFNSSSGIIDAFSFDSEKYNKLKLSEYVEKYNLDKSIICFFDSTKDMLIKQLSTKQKILLSIVGNIGYDCLIISLEALSERTKVHLVYFSYLLTNYKGGKTFVFLDYSTTKLVYDNMEVKIIRPSWVEESL